MSSQGGVQLPNDVQAAGYKQTRHFHFAQAFFSPKYNFTGTEEEFIEAGLAYRYRIIDRYTRIKIA